MNNLLHRVTLSSDGAWRSRTFPQNLVSCITNVRQHHRRESPHGAQCLCVILETFMFLKSHFPCTCDRTAHHLLTTSPPCKANGSVIYMTIETLIIYNFLLLFVIKLDECGVPWYFLAWKPREWERFQFFFSAGPTRNVENTLIDFFHISGKWLRRICIRLLKLSMFLIIVRVAYYSKSILTMFL